MENKDSEFGCRFCAIAHGRTFHGAADIPIDGDESYFSVASIGALVEGWSLIVPREHRLSLPGLYGQQALSAFTRRIVERVESRYGSTVVFEHGANEPGSLTNCGTDHAHLHVVPLAFSLQELVRISPLTDWKRIRASEISAAARTSEYLFFSEHPLEKDLTGYLHVLRTPISQFFRKLIANHTGKTAIADYRAHLLLDTAERTHQRLAHVD